MGNVFSSSQDCFFQLTYLAPFFVKAIFCYSCVLDNAPRDADEEWIVKTETTDHSRKEFEEAAGTLFGFSVRKSKLL